MNKTPDVRGIDFATVLRTWGFWGVVTGALALLLVVLQTAAPFFEPVPSVGSQIGEIAGDIKRDAWRSFFGGAVPEPEAPAVTAWTYLSVVGPVLGVLALLLSGLSIALNEDRPLGLYGSGLGMSAIVLHFFWWIALLVIGALILAAIIANIGSLFSFWG